MKNIFTENYLVDYFKLLYKYPIYIDMYREINSIGSLSNYIVKNSKIPKQNELSYESIAECIYKNYIMFFAAEQEIEELEAQKKYEMPVFGYDFELNKQYTEDEIMSTGEKIVYYNYLLKEYPQHITDRMRILSEKLNDLLISTDYLNQMSTLMSILNETMQENDMLLPVPPLRYETKIINEIKYLSTLLGIEQLESKQSPHKNLSNQKLKEEVKKLRAEIDERKKENTLLTLAEAMKYLKISSTTLYRLVKNQTLHHIIIGKKKYIDKQEIDDNMTVITGKRKT